MDLVRVELTINTSDPPQLAAYYQAGRGKIAERVNASVKIDHLEQLIQIVESSSTAGW